MKIKSLTINEKCWGRWSYLNNGKFCALGFLAEAHGVRADQGLEVDAVLWKRYGRNWCGNVQDANDEIRTNAKRKPALRKLFREKGIALRFVGGRA